MKNGNKPAYGAVAANEQEVISAHEYDESTSGLTKREAFAIAAMQGFCANINASPIQNYHFENLAVDAIKMADTLLDELAKENSNESTN